MRCPNCTTSEAARMRLARECGELTARLRWATEAAEKWKARAADLQARLQQAVFAAEEQGILLGEYLEEPDPREVR